MKSNILHISIYHVATPSMRTGIKITNNWSKIFIYTFHLPLLGKGHRQKVYVS